MRSSAHSACRIAALRSAGHALPTLPRNLRSTSARLIGCPGKLGMLSTWRATFRPSSRVAVMRVEGALPGGLAKAGSSITVILLMNARMRGSRSFSSA